MNTLIKKILTPISSSSKQVRSLIKKNPYPAAAITGIALGLGINFCKNYFFPFPQSPSNSEGLTFQTPKPEGPGETTKPDSLLLEDPPTDLIDGHKPLVFSDHEMSAASTQNDSHSHENDEIGRLEGRRYTPIRQPLTPYNLVNTSTSPTSQDSEPGLPLLNVRSARLNRYRSASDPEPLNPPQSTHDSKLEQVSFLMGCGELTPGQNQCINSYFQPRLSISGAESSTPSVFTTPQYSGSSNLSMQPRMQASTQPIRESLLEDLNAEIQVTNEEGKQSLQEELNKEELVEDSSDEEEQETPLLNLQNLSVLNPHTFPTQPLTQAPILPLSSATHSVVSPLPHSHNSKKKKVIKASRIPRLNYKRSPIRQRCSLIPRYTRSKQFRVEFKRGQINSGRVSHIPRLSFSGPSVAAAPLPQEIDRASVEELLKALKDNRKKNNERFVKKFAICAKKVRERRAAAQINDDEASQSSSGRTSPPCDQSLSDEIK